MKYALKPAGLAVALVTAFAAPALAQDTGLHGDLTLGYDLDTGVIPPFGTVYLRTPYLNGRLSGDIGPVNLQFDLGKSRTTSSLILFGPSDDFFVALHGSYTVSDTWRAGVFLRREGAESGGFTGISKFGFEGMYQAERFLAQGALWRKLVDGAPSASATVLRIDAAYQVTPELEVAGVFSKNLGQVAFLVGGSVKYGLPQAPFSVELSADRYFAPGAPPSTTVGLGLSWEFGGSGRTPMWGKRSLF